MIDYLADKPHIERPLPGETFSSKFSKGNIVGVIRKAGGGRTLFSDYALPKTHEENEKRKREFEEVITQLLCNHYIRAQNSDM